MVLVGKVSISALRAGDIAGDIGDRSPIWSEAVTTKPLQSACLQIGESGSVRRAPPGSSAREAERAAAMSSCTLPRPHGPARGPAHIQARPRRGPPLALETRSRTRAACPPHRTVLSLWGVGLQLGVRYITNTLYSVLCDYSASLSLACH